MYFSIDRFEGEYAVLIGDDGHQQELLRRQLPEGVREGDVLLYANDTFVAAPQEREARRGEVEDLLAQLLAPRDEDEK